MPLKISASLSIPSIRRPDGTFPLSADPAPDHPLLRFAKTGDAKTEKSTLPNNDVTNYGHNQLRNNDNGAEASSALCVQNSHDETAVAFYDWYVAKCYPHYVHSPHPRLKKTQRERILGSLDTFIENTGVDMEGLGAMANNYFLKVKGCDHNINHFATEGILQNRFYEECY